MKSLKILTKTLFVAMVICQIGYSTEQIESVQPSEQEDTPKGAVTEKQLNRLIKQLVITTGFREAISKGFKSVKSPIFKDERKCIFLTFKGKSVLRDRENFTNLVFELVHRKELFLHNQNMRNLLQKVVSCGKVIWPEDLMVFWGKHSKYLALPLKYKYLDFINIFDAKDNSEVACKFRKVLEASHDIQARMKMCETRSDDDEYYIIEKHRDAQSMPQSIPASDPIDIQEPLEHLAVLARAEEKVVQRDQRLMEIATREQNLQSRKKIEWDLLEEAILKNPSDVDNISKMFKELHFTKSEGPEDQKQNVRELVRIANMLDDERLDIPWKEFNDGFHLSKNGKFRFKDMIQIYKRGIDTLKKMYIDKKNAIIKECSKMNAEYLAVYHKFLEENRIHILSPILHEKIEKDDDDDEFNSYIREELGIEEEEEESLSEPDNTKKDFETSEKIILKDPDDEVDVNKILEKLLRRKKIEQAKQKAEEALCELDDAKKEFETLGKVISKDPDNVSKVSDILATLSKIRQTVDSIKF